MPGGLVTFPVLGVLVAPVVEELAFRGLWFERFIHTRWPVAGTLGLAVVFANLHALASPLPWLTWPVTFALALVFSVIFLKTSSWQAAAVAHASYNASVIAPLWLRSA